MFRALYKLRVRLLLLILIGAVPTLALIAYGGFQQRHAAATKVQEDALRLAQQVADLQERTIETTRSLLTLLARTTPVRNYARPDCSEFLASLLAQNSIYTNLGVVAPDGQITCSAIPISGPVDVTDRLYFQHAQEKGAFAVGRYQIGRITQRPGINVGFPVYTGRGKPAVVYAALDLASFNQVFASARLPPATVVTVVDQDNTVLARYPEAGLKPGQSAPVANTLRERLGEKPVGSFRLRIDEQDRLYAAARMLDRGGGDLLLFASIPAEVAYADANRALWRNFGALVLIGLALIVTAWAFSSRFVLRGFGALLDATRRLGTGDLNTRSGVPYHYGEVGELAQAFDDMAGALQTRSRELTQQQSRIDRLNRVHALLSTINSTTIRVQDRDALYTAACRIAVEQGRLALAAVVEIPPGEFTVKRVWRAGGEEDLLHLLPFPDEAITDRRSAMLAVLREGRAMVYNDVGKYPRAEPWQNDALELGYRACIFLPLQLDHVTVACLCLFAEELGFFDAEEQELLRGLAADISMGMDYLDKRERLNYLAYFDALTSLPNAALFRERVRQAAVGTRQHAGRLAVLVVAVDGLRELNHSHGHHTGDLLLREVADRLRHSLREADTVARLHADEFGVMLSDIREAEDVLHAVRKLLAAFEAPARLDTVEMFIAVRIGITVFPDDGREADRLVKNAGAAIASLPAGTSGYQFFTAQLQTQANQRLLIERELKEALGRGEFSLCYQPIVRLNDGRIEGVEALLRWRNPQLGEIPPTTFIPIAEETGLIASIGEWVLKQAATQAAAWQAAGHALQVAVNLSMVQLRRPDFTERLRLLLIDAGFTEGVPLMVEIRESRLMESGEPTRDALEKLVPLGVKMAVDDFGSGYSSLTRLNGLPVDTLKIDIELVRRLGGEPSDAAVVHATVVMAHHLGLRVIAEGVESAAELAALAEYGCDAAQGRHLYWPMPAEELTPLLAERA